MADANESWLKLWMDVLFYIKNACKQQREVM